MHVIFIPYGKRSEVELLLKDMECQKFKMPMSKGEEKSHVWVQGAIRLLPFGIHEYVFPKENLDAVLFTLGNIAKSNYASYVKEWQLKFLRKILKCEPAPEPLRKEYYMWVKDNVNMIIIGIRDDKDCVVETGQKLVGWSHEAI